MLTGDEAGGSPRGAGDPQTDMTLAWELLYRLEPELYDRLVSAERLHPDVRRLAAAKTSSGSSRSARAPDD